MPADRSVIAVAAGNGPDVVTAIVAAMSSGICAPFDPSRPPAEIDAFLADTMPSLVLADEATIHRHRESFNRHGVGVVRMIAMPSAPAGVFDVLAEEPYRHRAPVPEYGEDFVLLAHTSGTTSSSKVVPHTMPRLMHIWTSLVDALNMQPSDRCFNTMPLHYAYSTTSVIGPSLVAGASVICPANGGAAALIEGLRAYTPTWYVAAPPTHRDVLAYLRDEKTPPLDRSLRFIRTGGASIDVQLLIDLEATLGAPVLNGYGATEAPSSAFNLPLSNRIGSVGRPVGCEIAIFDGEVAIRGANVAPCYANGEREAIVDPVTGWYHTGDAGHIDADGFLYITGRLNELINVGGEKVAPGYVEQALIAHRAVADAVVFPLPHPTLGQHVAAAVVPHSNATVTEQQLIEHAALLLPRPAVPNVVHLVSEIPRDSSGKVRRRELATTFARNTTLAQFDPKSGQDNSLLGALARIWEDVLEYAPVALDENFFAAGGDSLRAIRVMTRIEADLQVTMYADTLLFAPTIRELAQAVLAQANGAHGNRIVALRATGSRPPLFFYYIDAAGGGGLFVRFLPAALDVEQPIYLVRPHGARDDAIPESIEAMAAADAVMIAATVPSQTYRLAGFCAGGVVAFEVARCLEHAGSTVDLVALIASSAPNALLEPLWTWVSRAGASLTQLNQSRVYRLLRSIANALRTRSYPAEIFNAVYDKLHPSPPMAADIRIYDERVLRYFPQRTMLSVDLIWPDDDRLMLSGDPTMGWRHVARVRRHSVRGDHETVLTDHIGELGTVLRRIFDSADE